MGRILKFAVIILLSLIVLAVIVAAIVLRPYYKMPDIDQAVLEEKLSSWQTIADEMANRPTTDREMFLQLLEDNKNFFQAELGWKDDNCPPFDPEKVKPRLEEIEKNILLIDQQLNAILADGVVLQQSIQLDAEFPPFGAMQSMIKNELIVMLVEVERKQYALAVNRWLRIANLTDEIARTPALLYSMVYVSMQKVMLQTLQCVKADLPPEQLQNLIARIEQQPDIVKQLFRSSQAEMFVIDSLGTKEMLGKSGSPSLLIWLIDATGYLKRERMFVLNISDRVFSEWERWDAAGRQGLPTPMNPDELKYSLFASMAIPNFDKLLEKTVESEKLKADTLTALREELSKR